MGCIMFVLVQLADCITASLFLLDSVYGQMAQVPVHMKNLRLEVLSWAGPVAGIVHFKHSYFQCLLNLVIIKFQKAQVKLYGPLALDASGPHLQDL